MDFLTAEWWVPRWCCGWFPPWLVAVYMLSNAIVWLAYESIPYTLSDLQSRSVRIFGDEATSAQFVRFIRACGRGHLIENCLAFCWPHYLFFAVWHCYTAFVSIRTAQQLRGLHQQILSKETIVAVTQLKTAVEMEEGIEELKKIASRIVVLTGESR